MNTRASEALYDSLCPGRFLAQQGIPEPEASEDAKFGRSVHAALAKGDPTGLDSKQLDIYESCQAICARAVADYFGIDAPAALLNPIREREFKVTIDGFEHIGHPDVVYRIGTKAMIPDFKTLPGEHSSSDQNLQLRDYVVLVFYNSLLLDEVATAIIQPLVSHTPTICVYDPPSIRFSMGEMIARVKASNDPKSPRLPGEIQCKFCRARPQCREYSAWVGNKLPVLHGVFNVPVDQWLPEQRAIFCQNRKVAQQWLDDTEQAMKALLAKDSEAIPGWKLKEGNEVESLTNIQLIFERFVELGGKTEQFMECLKGLTIKGRLEGQVREITGRKGQGLKRTMQQLTNGASEFKKNAPSLKRKD